MLKINNTEILMKKHILSENPLIYYVDDVLNKNECEHIIQISTNKLKPALVSGNLQGFKSPGRTGKNYWLSHKNDEITFKIASKITNIVNKPLENAENFQVLYYSKNQKYEYHYDAFPLDNSDKAKRCLRKGGQRLLTALIYLNNVIQGGETEFKNLNIKITPKIGRILVFENTINNSLKKHPDSLHSGKQVIEGEKYVINLWFRHLPTKEIFNIEKYLADISNKPKNLTV